MCVFYVVCQCVCVCVCPWERQLLANEQVERPGASPTPNSSLRGTRARSSGSRLARVMEGRGLMTVTAIWLLNVFYHHVWLVLIGSSSCAPPSAVSPVPQSQSCLCLHWVVCSVTCLFPSCSGLFIHLLTWIYLFCSSCFLVSEQGFSELRDWTHPNWKKSTSTKRSSHFKTFLSASH